MEVSLLLMEQIAQLFIVLLMGYIVVKAKLLKPSDSKVLSVVFVYLIMPCVVLNAFQIDDTPELRAGLLYSMAIAVGMHVVFLAFDTVIRRPLKLDAVERVNIIYSNAAALVIPLVQALLGSEYVVYSCAFVIVQLILLWTHASACLQGSTKLEWKKDPDQCQPDCDCGRSALVSVAHFFASANREHTQQRRKYDWTYGNAAGRHGNRRGPAEKGVLHTAELPPCCASSADGSCHCSFITPGGTCSRLDFRWQGNFDDSLSLCHHTLLCNCHFHGSAVQS